MESNLCNTWTPISLTLSLSFPHLFLSPAVGGGPGNFRQKFHGRERESSQGQAERLAVGAHFRQAGTIFQIKTVIYLLT